LRLALHRDSDCRFGADDRAFLAGEKRRRDLGTSGGNAGFGSERTEEVMAADSFVAPASCRLSRGVSPPAVGGTPTGQPGTAALQVRSNYGLATTLGDLFRARQR